MRLEHSQKYYFDGKKKKKSVKKILFSFGLKEK